MNSSLVFRLFTLLLLVALVSTIVGWISDRHTATASHAVGSVLFCRFDGKSDRCTDWIR